MQRAILSVILAPVLACATTGDTSRAEPGPRSALEPMPGPAPTFAMLTSMNEKARAGGTSETLHGLTIEDPYRDLEQDTDATRAWIDAQNARTERAMAGFEQPAMAARLEKLLSVGSLHAAHHAGKRTFYMKREGEREQAALFMVAAHAPEAAPLIDPLTYGKRAALDYCFPSEDGTRLAFGISHNGDERSTLHVIDVEKRALLPEQIERTKWSSVTWLHDGKGFYYTRYPNPGEPDFDRDHEDSYFPRVYFHSLGTDPAADPLVFGSDDGTDFPSVSVSDDDRWIVINVFRGWSTSDVYLFDRGAQRQRVRPDEDHPQITVIEGEESLTFGEVHRGHLYLLTNHDAPKWRIATATPKEAHERGRWEDVIPESEATIEGIAFTKDRIAVHYIDDVRSRVRLFDHRGRARGEVPLAEGSSIDSISSSSSGRRIALIVSGYLLPPTLYSYDTRTQRLDTLDQVKTDIQLDGFELSRHHVQSKDGTRIPVTLLGKKGLPQNGDVPVLLTGYGGFNISLLPSFTRNAFYFMEQGGVYAVANLRGGNEYGEAWHRAGNLENKTNVFDDFEAVIRWLSSSGVSRPERIAITGRSNGGLLVGALITRAPETFGAAAAYVGLYDMVRYHKFPPAELWISEYGDPEEPEPFKWLYAYSPYHHVEKETPYPTILIETADHDSRVHWAHSTKFAARLQEATGSDDPIYFFMEEKIGHGAGTRLSDLVRRYVRMYMFLEDALGMNERPNVSER